MNVLIGGAWPYANGPLHIGHIAALLPGDVLARYHRAKGDKVAYVSGGDCHGTPVTIRAAREGITPREASERYHQSFSRVFAWLGFSYDRYGKTSCQEHLQFVMEFHKKMYQGGYVYEKEAPQAYCSDCGVYLTDRMVEGLCPVCGAPARGDQCDACGAVLEPETLQSPRCANCGAQPVFRPCKQLYLAVSRLQGALQGFVDAHPDWRKNAQAFSRRYLNEGLRDRAITRNLNWGVAVPRPGYDGKRIYIWAENVLGYLSMSREVCRERGWKEEQLWAPEEGNCRHYYVHGKDNIPFHTIILPALLLANGGPWRLPDVIVSSEYLTLEGKKISTSHNWAVWAQDLAGRYDPDSLRYYFLANGPEKRDADFSFSAYVAAHNGELLGAYGNLVNRTLAFVQKYLAGVVPQGEVDPVIAKRLRGLFDHVGALIEQTRFKEALDEIFACVHETNRYYDSQQPWKTRSSDALRCAATIYQCVQVVANLAVLLAPFLPFSSQKVLSWLGLTGVWRPQFVPGGYRLPGIGLLFQRLDKGFAQQEKARLLPQG